VLADSRESVFPIRIPPDNKGGVGFVYEDSELMGLGAGKAESQINRWLIMQPSTWAEISSILDHTVPVTTELARLLAESGFDERPDRLAGLL